MEVANVRSIRFGASISRFLFASMLAACTGQPTSVGAPSDHAELTPGAMHPDPAAQAATAPPGPSNAVHADVVASGHPLDPLSGDEISAAVAAIQAKGYNGPTTYIPVIRLQEPDKDDVLAWSP